MLKTGVINVAHSGLEDGGEGISIGEFLFVPTTFTFSKILRIYFFWHFIGIFFWLSKYIFLKEHIGGNL